MYAGEWACDGGRDRGESVDNWLSLEDFDDEAEPRKPEGTCREVG